MTDSRKQKLINLGPHALADALLNLAVHSDEAISVIRNFRINQHPEKITKKSPRQDTGGFFMTVCKLKCQIKTGLANRKNRFAVLFVENFRHGKINSAQAADDAFKTGNRSNKM